MSNTIVFDTLKQKLLTHLSDTENEKNRVLDEFFPNETTEKYTFKSYMDNYISTIHHFVHTYIETSQQEQRYPFVMIGSIAEVEDLEDGEISQIHIVSPFLDNAKNTMDCASYLSPMGRALLLKKINEIFCVETPAGQFEYKINSITML